MLDELERVRALGSDEPGPSDLTIDAARAELLRAISDAPAAPRTRTRRAGRHRRRRTALAVAVTVTAAAVAIAGALAAITASSPQTALAAAMDRLARIAASQAWAGTPGPGQYMYTQSAGTTESDIVAKGSECRISQTDHRQIWIATNGAGAISETRDLSRFTSTADQAICARLGITDPSSQNSSWSNSFPPGGLSLPVHNWHDLSTDPAQLLTQLRVLDGGPATAAEDFVHIGDFLRETDAPPAIRAALYSAAALIPGTKLKGPQTDPVGRPGLGVAFVDRNGQVSAELIFDQQTAKLLAEEYFGPDGKLGYWTAYLRSGIVTAHPDYPPVGSGTANG
jgi:hypothetical protein